MRSFCEDIMADYDVVDMIVTAKDISRMEME